MNIQKQIEEILIKIRTGKEVTIGDDTIIENLLNTYLKEKARADKLEKEYSKMLTKLDENNLLEELEEE